MIGRRSHRATVALGLVVVGACTGSDNADPAPSDTTVTTAATTQIPQITTDDTIGTPTDETSATTPVATVPEKNIVTRSPEAVGDGSPPQGVGTATIRIIAEDGTVCEVCMWFADESTERSTGLMGVQDLGGPVGMAFAWDEPTTGNFLMFGTPTPLSVAWFGPDDSYLSQTDMDPCLDETSTRCDRFNTTGPYILAIEMFRDGSGASQLAEIGIGPGSTASVVARFDGSACDPTR